MDRHITFKIHEERLADNERPYLTKSDMAFCFALDDVLTGKKEKACVDSRWIIKKDTWSIDCCYNPPKHYMRFLSIYPDYIDFRLNGGENIHFPNGNTAIKRKLEAVFKVFLTPKAYLHTRPSKGYDRKGNYGIIQGLFFETFMYDPYDRDFSFEITYRDEFRFNFKEKTLKSPRMRFETIPSNL